MQRGGRFPAPGLLGLALIIVGFVVASATSVAAPIELFIDGKAVQADSALKLLGTGLGVAASLLEPLGVEVDDSAFPVIEIRYGGRHALLTVDDNQVLIDGKPVNIGSSAVMREETLFLPLSLIADLTKFRVDWNTETGVLSLEQRGETALSFYFGTPSTRQGENIAQSDAQRRLGESGQRRFFPEDESTPVIVDDVDIFVADEHVHIAVSADRAVDANVMFLPEPARLVIDIDNAVLATAWQASPGDGKIIKQLRAAVTPEGSVRIVADLTGPTGYTLADNAGLRGVTVRLNQQLDVLGTTDLADDGVAVRMYASGPLRYRIFSLRQPERFVIDLFGATLPEATEFALPGPLARTFRISQYEHDVVRGVFVLEGQRPSGTFGEGEGRIEPDGDGIFQLWLSDAGIAATTPAAMQALKDRPLPNGLRYVGYTRHDDAELIFIRAEDPLDVSVLRLSEPDRVVLDLKGTMVERSLGLTLGPGGLVKAVRAGQAAESAGRVVAETTGVPEHRMLFSPDRTRAVLSLRRSGVGGRTIVVDAGHGGKDPGAIGYSGTFEKDVTLAIALKVADLLKQSGANVVLTRERDVELSLPERAQLANELKADAFVSIHADAVGFGRIARGTSTFYHPENGNGPETSVNKRYAESLQRSLLETLGLRDRGVHQREFHVVLNTKMPSALVEVAFIDNPEEEKMLNDPKFQARAATGIVNGIVRFFEGEHAAVGQWQPRTEQVITAWLNYGVLPAEVSALQPTALFAGTPLDSGVGSASSATDWTSALLEALQQRLVRNVDF